MAGGEVVYFHRNGWYTFTETGGILSPKWVVYFHRNGWYNFTEMGGILSPKWVVYFRRNIHSNGVVSRNVSSDGQKIATIHTAEAERVSTTNSLHDCDVTGVEYPNEEEFTIYPNPTSDISSIDYSIPSQKQMSIKVFNVFGAEVAAILDGVQYQGQHSMKIETDTIEQGIYVIRFAADSILTYKKFVVAR